jgi:hypothetical protein
LNSSLKIIGFFVFAALILTGCSRKKDKFINRNFHAMATKYNVLYNGYLALEKGRETVDDAFTDNYWELLPIERMQVSEEILLPGQSKNSDFEREGVPPLCIEQISFNFTFSIIPTFFLSPVTFWYYRLVRL